MEQGFSEELKERQRYWLEHLRAANAQGLKLAAYARVAQLDSDALYRWRALFKRQGILIAASTEAVPVSFAAVRVARAEVCSSGEVSVYIGAQVHVRCTSWPDPRWLAELSQCLQEQR
ncbi:MAG TPA: hypothetical protein VGR92_14265 [Steroidobacteraceae bacterium]|nr:hypothetical protein [Steroidobacteraceae bacterium]